MNNQFRVLVAHFFNQFFDRDSQSEEADAHTRMIQFLVCLSLPGLLMSFFLVPDHPPGSSILAGATTEFQRMWMRSGDRYVFVCYAMCVMGLVMTYKWDSLFPDRRDYLILVPQPISAQKVFLAKTTALAVLLAAVVTAINLFPLLIMPSVYSASARIPFAYGWALLSQMLGTVGGSIFAALVFAALQGVLINILPPAIFRRISPWLQTLSMATLFVVLLVIPLVKELIEPLSQMNSHALDYIPVIWFLGLFEAFLPGGTLMPMAFSWGKMALEATGAAVLVCAMSYFAGYRRYSRRVLESETDSPITGTIREWRAQLLNLTVLRNPFERATFFFTGKVAARSAKHRLMTALYFGAAIALAVSSLFVISYRAPASLRVSSIGVLEAPIILSFLIVSGLRATFNVPYELRANWIFQLSSDGNSADALRAVRKWIFLCRILPCYVVVAFGEFFLFTAAVAVAHLIFDLVLSFVLIEVLFSNFNKVPFTCSDPKNKFQLGAIAAGYLYGFTIYVEVAGHLKQWIAAAPPRLLAFMLVCFAALAIFGVLRTHRQQRTRVSYEETDGSLLSLSSDHGYWILPRTSDRRETAESDLAAEIQAHLQMAVQDRIVAGQSADEAAHSAKLDFGNVASVKERTRSVWTWTFVEQFLQDVRFGMRILWKSPGLCATAAILIALVIGGNTTVYSMMHALITKPAPGVTGRSLVTLSIAGQPFNPGGGGFMDYITLLNQVKSISPLIGFRPERLTLALPDGNWAFIGDSVTPNYFETLGVRFARGRPFTADENSLSSQGLAVIISFRVWQEQFHAAENVIGYPVLVNGYPATIVGVTAGKFQGPVLGVVDDMWVPLLSYARRRGVEQMLFTPPAQPGHEDLQMAFIGRLAEGASISSAQAEFDTLAINFTSSNGQRPVKFKISHYFAASWGGIADASAQFFAVFSVITAITLFIGCATVANLMLSRALERQRETSLRLALGAPRKRLLRMMLIEGMSVGVVAWGLSCVMANWATTAIPRLIPSDFRAPNGLRMNHMNVDFSPDWGVLGYAMLLALIAAVAFTLAPALRCWRRDLLTALKGGEQTVVGRRHGIFRTLVVVQLAFSVVLLTSTAIAYRSLGLVKTFDVAFDAHNLLLVTVNPSLISTDRLTNLLTMERLRQQFRAISGVSSVSYIRLPPPYFTGEQTAQSSGAKDGIQTNVNYVGPDYLSVLGVKPLLGREFAAGERLNPAASCLVSEEVAEALWPGQSALGQILLLGTTHRSVEVVGVFPRALFVNRRIDPGAKNFVVLLAEQQDPAPMVGQTGLLGSGEVTFYLRYSGNLDAVETAVGASLRNVDNRIALTYMRTMENQLEAAFFGLRPLTLLLSSFAAISLTIATIGQYAVMAFEMRRRNREFGVRVAMGASSRQIVTAVLREGFSLTACGLILGLALSLAAAVAMRGFIYGVSTTDATAYIAAFTVLGTASLLSCYLPARRASRIDPLTTLRGD